MLVTEATNIDFIHSVWNVPPAAFVLVLVSYRTIAFTQLSYHGCTNTKNIHMFCDQAAYNSLFVHRNHTIISLQCPIPSNNISIFSEMSLEKDISFSDFNQTNNE